MREAAGSRRAEASARILWHDLECGSYAADLALWEQLAARAREEILELGCGSGRVALHLARRGYRVTGVDTDPHLARELNRRAAGLPAEALLGDARELELGRRFGLVLAPMQLIQLLDGREQRRRLLETACRHLAPEGQLAIALLAPEDETDRPPPAAPPIPDVREEQGWVYSSLPLTVIGDGSRISIRRLRQTVSPQGTLNEEENEVSLAVVSPMTVEAEAGAAGLAVAGRRSIAPTEDHVGSVVVLLEAG